jgi:ADP-heptose:LPS heptosyltransferase
MLQRILVIRLSALGDFVMALPAMAAIRNHHPAAHITLLTTAPLAEIGRRSGWFDAIEIDNRPKLKDVAEWWRLRRRLRAGRFDRVYDLQSQDRTAFYFRLFWPGRRPEWSGIVPAASHPHTDPDRRRMHARDIHAAQLRIAGIADVPEPELGWLAEPKVLRSDLPGRFALLIPGSAPHRPAKRWPAESYGQLAAHLAGRGIVPIVIGSGAEADLALAIRNACPDAVDMTGRTSLFAIASLARLAELAIGNDTGPMHLIAMVGCPVVSLFSAESDPLRSAPRGPAVAVLRYPDLRDLDIDDVIAAIARVGGAPLGAKVRLPGNS